MSVDQCRTPLHPTRRHLPNACAHAHTHTYTHVHARPHTDTHARPHTRTHAHNIHSSHAWGTVEHGIPCAQGHFPDASIDPVIQIASMITVQGESKPIVKNVMTLGSCAPIVGAEVLSFDRCGGAPLQLGPRCFCEMGGVRAPTVRAEVFWSDRCSRARDRLEIVHQACLPGGEERSRVLASSLRSTGAWVAGKPGDMGASCTTSGTGPSHPTH